MDKNDSKIRGLQRSFYKRKKKVTEKSASYAASLRGKFTQVTEATGISEKLGKFASKTKTAADELGVTDAAGAVGGAAKRPIGQALLASRR